MDRRPAHEKQDYQPTVRSMSAHRKTMMRAMQLGRQFLAAMLRCVFKFVHAQWPRAKWLTTKEGIIAVVLLAIVIALVSEVGRNVVVIDAFSVPKRIEEDGYGPAVIANQLADDIADLREQAGRFARDHPQFALSSEATLPDVQVAEAKVSLNGIVEYLRRILGKEHATVDGAISFPPPNTAPRTDQIGLPARLLITVRVRKGSTLRRYKQIDVPANDLAGGLLQATREIFATLDPLVLAVSYHAKGNATEAAEFAQRCSHDPNKRYAAKCYVMQGALLFEKGTPDHYQRAVQMFEAALRLDNSLPQAMIDQGVAYQRLNQFPLALAMFSKAERVIKDDPDMLAAVHVNRGQVFYKQQNLPKAIAEYEQAAHIDPQHALAYNNWCDALITQGRVSEARPICQQAIDADPQFAMGYATFGELLSKQGQLTEAYAMFRRATELDPHLIAAWMAWGEALTSAGRPEEAQAVYQEGYQKNPNDQRFIVRLMPHKVPLGAKQQ
jgi:tetratricopeptide (TPR) repeat protein